MTKVLYKFVAIEKESVLTTPAGETNIAIVDLDPNNIMTGVFRVIERDTKKVLFEGKYSACRKFALATL